MEEKRRRSGAAFYGRRGRMHCVNEYVSYGTQGICQIEAIRSIQFEGCSGAREYYVLHPIDQVQSSIFVPVDNQRLTDRMRPVLSPKEIDRAILSVKGRQLSWVRDRKQRAELFHKILTERKPEDLLLLAGCLYRHAQEEPKGLSSSDAQALKTAEATIEQEFAFSLQLGTRTVGSYIREKLGLAEDAVPGTCE